MQVCAIAWRVPLTSSSRLSSRVVCAWFSGVAMTDVTNSVPVEIISYRYFRYKSLLSFSLKNPSAVKYGSAIGNVSIYFQRFSIFRLSGGAEKSHLTLGIPVAMTALRRRR